MKHIVTYALFLVTFLLSSRPAGAQLRSPDDFLPHQLGETFTPHHLLVDYMEHVAANSPNVQLTEYGRTWEQRPLLLAYVSTPENLARLDDIRRNNLRRAGVESGSTNPDLDLAIVWLSFSVHGNEAAGSESSMAVIYELANPANARTQEWLRNTIVIIDPSINPDGYSRYTHWYRGIANRFPDPHAQTWEHLEPWPGGRANHYLFDLNRDWAWQTQVESQQRIDRYHQWLPHIHVDVHEQGYNSPYYFAPAARPFHPYITEWQRRFQVEIGKNNARYFDAEGWLYFTRERFDLFYPSYGDTYPTYNGAIGMTYEQGGIRAGRAIITENGDTLTLRDRILHHKTTTLATVETASRNAAALIQNFDKYYNNARSNPPGAYKTFVIKGDNPAGRLRAFCALLDRNRIAYERAGRSASLSGYDYTEGKEVSFKVESGDLLISAYQPHGVMAQILLEPEAELEDSLTYDITAWALPYAYGLQAFATTQRLGGDGAFQLASPAIPSASARPYAYLGEWEALSDAGFLAALMREGITVRCASEPFSIEGQSYQPGTLVVLRADNQDLGDRFFRTVSEIAAANQKALTTVSTGFSDRGHDLGSNVMRVLHKPNIAVLSGEGTSSLSFGQVWYFFEQNLGYPVSMVPADNFQRIRLDDFNLLIMPEGRYRLSEAATEKLGEWISGGGRLIAIGSALNSLSGAKGFALKRKANGNGNGDDNDELNDYSSQERRYISQAIPGAVIAVDIDNTHPLGYGLSRRFFSLKDNEQAFAKLERGWNVGTLGDELQISGFAGAKARENIKNTMVFGVENKGRGSITYLSDNPLFRAFWENGKFLFSNAVFMVE